MSATYQYTRADIIKDNLIEDVIRRYVPDLKQRGAELVGLCPIHKEKSPSFYVHPDKRVFNCFGCGAKGSVIDFVSKVEGISIAEAMTKLTPEQYRRGSAPTPMRTAQVRTQAPQATPEPKPEPKEPLILEKEYNYTDATGKLAYQVVRFHPKTFRQRHKNPIHPKADRDGWVWGMEGVQRVLYRLPKVLKAEVVWIVEGEKDVESLEQFAFVATCNVGGAGKWMEGYTESLKGKDIVLCGDSDEPGQKHVELVMQSLAGKVRSVRVVKLPEGCKDISDYIATLPTDKEPIERAEILFNTLVKDLPMLTRGVNLPIYSMEEMEQRYRFEIQESKNSVISLGRWLPSFNKLRGLVPGELVVFLADTGVGKTMILQNIAISASPVPSLIFELELPDTLTFERFAAMGTKCEAREIYEIYKRGNSIQWNLYGHKLKHIHVCPESGLSPDEIEAYIVSSELKIGQKPRFIGIDYAQLVQSKKAKSRYERMSDVAEQLKVIAKRTKTVIVLLSQISRNKNDESAEVGLHDGKDSGAIENSSGLVIGAWRDPNNSSVMMLRVLKSTKGGAGLLVKCNINGETLNITEQSPIDPNDYTK